MRFILKPLVKKIDFVEQYGLSMNQPPAPISTQPLWQTAPSVSTPLFPSLSTSTLTPASPQVDQVLLSQKKLIFSLE